MSLQLILVGRQVPVRANGDWGRVRLEGDAVVVGALGRQPRRLGEDIPKVVKELVEEGRAGGRVRRKGLRRGLLAREGKGSSGNGLGCRGGCGPRLETAFGLLWGSSPFLFSNSN